MAAPAPQGPLRRRRRRVSLAVLGKRAVEVFRAEEEAGVAREVADRAAAVGGSQRSAPRRAGVLEEAEGAACGSRTRERAARLGAAAARLGAEEEEASARLRHAVAARRAVVAAAAALAHRAGQRRAAVRRVARLRL